MMMLKTLALPGLLIAAQSALAQQAAPPMLDPGYATGIPYATVTRGGVTEKIFTSPEAIAAARAGQPFPYGTVITMEDHRAGALSRIIVMEKRMGAPLGPAGGWSFAEFDPQGRLNPAENGQRCAACHAGQTRNDFVFTRPRMID